MFFQKNCFPFYLCSEMAHLFGKKKGERIKKLDSRYVGPNDFFLKKKRNKKKKAMLSPSVFTL